MDLGLLLEIEIGSDGVREEVRAAAAFGIPLPRLFHQLRNAPVRILTRADFLPFSLDHENRFHIIKNVPAELFEHFRVCLK